MDDKWTHAYMNPDDAPFHDERSIADIIRQQRNGYVPDTDYDAMEAHAYGWDKDDSESFKQAWDLEASPNTRTPVSMADYERDRQQATQQAHKSFWAKVSSVLLSHPWGL